MNNEVKKIYDKLTDKIPYEIDRVLFAIIDALPDEPPPEQYHVRGANGKTCKYTPGMIIPADAIVVVGPEPKDEKASEPTSAPNQQLCPHGWRIGGYPTCHKCLAAFLNDWQARNDMLRQNPEERLIDQQIEEVKAGPTSAGDRALIELGWGYIRGEDEGALRKKCQAVADARSQDADLGQRSDPPATSKHGRPIYTK